LGVFGTCLDHEHPANRLWPNGYSTENPGKMPTSKREALTEARCRQLWAWPGGEAYTLADTKMPGLLLRKGKRRTAWHFYHDRSLHGQRIVTSKVLGSMPNMTLADARRAAKKQIGRIAADRPEPGKRSAVKFSDALDEYMIHLRDRAARAGKEASWAKRVDGLAKLYLRPKWGKWSLATMSDNPAAVRDWHADLAARAPVSANHAARVVRAVYRHAARLNWSLPPGLPTSAVRFAKEVPRQAGLPFDQWPAWGRAWTKIGSPTRRAFALLGLLTGCRPGELCRLKWADVKPGSRSITIRAGKAGLDVVLPMSAAIARALKLARGASDRNGYVFPARAGGHLAQFAGDGLPAHGHALRHCYRDAALAAGVDEFVVRLLMGHSLRGISQEYVTRAVISSGPSLRAAQRAISKRIVTLLG
jgi:integrase